MLFPYSSFYLELPFLGHSVIFIGKLHNILGKWLHSNVFCIPPLFSHRVSDNYYCKETQPHSLTQQSQSI